MIAWPFNPVFPGEFKLPELGTENWFQLSANPKRFLETPGRPKSIECKRRMKSEAGGARKVRHLPGRRERGFGDRVKPVDRATFS
jgi:hypothetical protein